jgi:hypothetical protein
LLKFSRKPIFLFHAVFKTTNPFYSSNLANLETNFNQRLSKSSRLAIAGKLAYYCHTNDLSKTNTLASMVLALDRLLPGRACLHPHKDQVNLF